MRITEINHIRDQELLSGLIRIHILYHACKEPIFGLGMIEEFRPLFTARGVEVTPAKVVQTLSQDELCELLPGREGEPLRDVTIFTLFREDFDPGLAPGIRAFDARGERLI